MAVEYSRLQSSANQAVMHYKTAIYIIGIYIDKIVFPFRDQHIFFFISFFNCSKLENSNRSLGLAVRGVIVTLESIYIAFALAIVRPLVRSA